MTTLAQTTDEHVDYTVNRIERELADGPRSAAELIEMLGEDTFAVIKVMAEFGGVRTFTTQDGVKFYGLGDGDASGPADTG